MRPSRPTRRDAKGDWQRWAYDAFDRNKALFGSGVYTNTFTTGTLRRLMRQNRNRRRRDEDEDEALDVAAFGFVFSTIKGFILWTHILDSGFQVRHEYDSFLSPSLPFPGNPGFPFPDSGLGIPTPFQFTSPFRKRSILISTGISSEWAKPFPWPRTLAAGESVLFNVPSILGNGAYTWDVTIL